MGFEAVEDVKSEELVALRIETVENAAVAGAGIRLKEEAIRGKADEIEGRTLVLRAEVADIRVAARNILFAVSQRLYKNFHTSLAKSRSVYFIANNTKLRLWHPYTTCYFCFVFRITIIVCNGDHTTRGRLDGGGIGQRG